MNLTTLEWVLIGIAIFEAFTVWVLLWKLPTMVDIEAERSAVDYHYKKWQEERERREAAEKRLAAVPPLDRLGSGRY